MGYEPMRWSPDKVTYNGLKRAMARYEVADEILPQYREMRNQVIQCMPKWAKYSGTPSWAQVTLIRANLAEVAKLAHLPQDDRGFSDAVAYVLFDHALATISKQEAEGLIGWMAFQPAEDDKWYLSARGREGLLALAKDPAFDALRRRVAQVRAKYDGMDHGGPGIMEPLDPFEAELLIARLMGREVGTMFYHMVRGKA